MLKNIEYKSNNNIVFSCKYHIIWCSKYRRKALTSERPKEKDKWKSYLNDCEIK